jgi:hypothetical protein
MVEPQAEYGPASHDNVDNIDIILTMSQWQFKGFGKAGYVENVEMNHQR